jgi:geranylgeranyl pyrophosphate synthase
LPQYANQKGWCEDLDEGKISLPLIYTLSTPGAKKNEIVSLMRNKSGATMPKEMKQFILREMQSAGAIDRTKALLKSMQEDLMAELNRLEEVFGSANPMIQAVLEKLWI